MSLKKQLKERLDASFRESGCTMACHAQGDLEFESLAGFEPTNVLVLSLQYDDLNPETIIYAIRNHDLKKIRPFRRDHVVILTDIHSFAVALSLAHFLVTKCRFSIVAWQFPVGGPTVVIDSTNPDYPHGYFLYHPIPTTKKDDTWVTF